MKTPKVYLGDYQTLDVRHISDTQLVAVTPNGMASGVYDVRVCNPNQKCGLLPKAFTITNNDTLVFDVYLPALWR